MSEGFSDGAFVTSIISISRVCMEISEEDEFIALIVTLFSADVSVQVGEDTTLVPTKVAQEPEFVGVIVEGKIILTIPLDDKASIVVILKEYVVSAHTVEVATATVPDKELASA